jgi:hypothetical protein
MQTVPPSLTPVQTVLIQDSNVSAPLFRSYVRLYASAWQRAYECTGPLDLDAEIAPLLDLPPSLARLHLRRLRSAGLIDWKRDARRRYVIHFPHSNGSSKANPACQGAEPQTWHRLCPPRPRSHNSHPGRPPTRIFTPRSCAAWRAPGYGKRPPSALPA